MSDDKEEKRCPLCAEEIDGTDQLKPCQCGYQKMEEWRRMVPPGVRFSPTPAELLNEYLRPRVNNQSVPKGVIRELNVYQFNPMELKAFAIDNGDNQNMYFFTNLQRKTKDGVQIRRGTNDGCWRASNKYLNIFLETVLIGFRKDLTYTWKSGGHGRWLMKEYVLEKQSDLALCVIYERPELQNNKDTSAPVQPPQVESGFGECATSIDTRPLQIRDSDAIIERDLQYSAEKDHDREDLRGNLAIEIGRKTSALNSCLKNVSEGDGTLPLPPEVPSQYHANSKGTQVYAGRDFGIPHGERWESVERIDGIKSRKLHDVKEAVIQDGHSMRMENIKRPFGEYDEQSGETEGSQRGLHNKYMGSRYREWDDHLKSQYENIDGHRGNSTHRKRDRDHVMNEQKGYEQTRIKEDNHYSSKHKEEGWFQRSESLKEQDEWHVSHDETLLKRERVARWGGMRSRQAVEDKAWITREKDGYKGSAKDYQLKDTGRQSETRNDRSFDDSNGHGAHDKTSKDNARKSKESKGRAHNPSGYCKRNQEDIGGQINEKRGFESQGKYSMRCDDVSQRGHHNKYMGSRYREWDDHLRSQYENIDGHRENSTHRKRDRDDIMNEQKGYEQTRIKEDNHYSSKHKEEGWFQRSESLKEQGEWHMSHDDSLLKRERVARWGGMRSRQAVEDKAWITHAREKDGYKGSAKDYQLKDTGRQSEQVKRRDRVEDESSLRRGRENDYPSAHNPSGYCKRNQEDIGGQINEK